MAVGANVIELALVARNEMTGVLRQASGELQGFAGVIGRFGAAAGAIGVVASAAVGVGTAVVNMGRDISNTVEDLDRMSQRTGVSIENLQVLKQTLKEAGVDFGSVSQGLNFLNRAIATNDPLLAKLGITTHDVHEAFLQLSDIFGASNDAAKKTEIAYQLLGRGGAELIGVMSGLRAKTGEVGADMLQLGGILSGDAAAGARALDKDLDELGRKFESSMTRAKKAVIPAAIEIVDAFNDMWDAMTGRKKTPTEVADRSIRELEKLIKSFEGRVANLSATNEGVTPGRDKELAIQQKALEDLRFRLEERRRLAAGFSSDDLDPFGREVSTGAKATSDALAGVTLDGDKKPKKAGPSEREKSILDLMKTLGGTRAQAELLFDSLERVELTKKRADLMKQFPSVFENFNAPPEVTADTEGSGSILNTITEAMKATEEASKVAMKATQAFAQITSDAITTVAQALGAGLGDVMAGLIDGTIAAQNVILAVLSAIRNVVAQVLATIVQQLAIFGILSAFGMAPAGGVGSFILKGLGGAISARPSPASGREAGSAGVVNHNTNVHVEAIDVKSIKDAFLSQTGGFRRAYQQMSGPQEGWQ